MFIYPLHAWCHEGWKWASSSWEFELQTVMTCHGDTKNLIQFFFKSNKYS